MRTCSVCNLLLTGSHSPAHAQPLQQDEVIMIGQRISSLERQRDTWVNAMATLRSDIEAKEAAVQALPPPVNNTDAMNAASSQANQLMQQVGRGRGGRGRVHAEAQGFVAI